MSGFNPFESNNQIGVTIKGIKNLSSLDEKVKAVRSCVNTLIYEALQRDEAELKVIQVKNSEIFYAKFDYNGSIYYWTEKHNQAVPFKKFNQAEIELYSKEGLLKNGIPVLYYEWRCFKDVLPNTVYTLSYQTIDKENYVGFSSKMERNNAKTSTTTPTTSTTTTTTQTLASSNSSIPTDIGLKIFLIILCIGIYLYFFVDVPINSIKDLVKIIPISVLISICTSIWYANFK